MQEVIINPVAAPSDMKGNFLELNVFMQIAKEKVIPMIEHNTSLELYDPLKNQEQQ